MALTRADFARIARNRIRITPGAQLDPASVDKTGSTVNILVNAVAAIGEELEARSAARFGAQLVASAREGDLDRLILERSKGKLPRKGTAAAAMVGYLIRPTAAAGDGVVPAGTEISAGGLTWTTNTSAHFFREGLQDSRTVRVIVTCTTTGRQGNGIAPDQYQVARPAELFDPTITVFESFEGPSVGGDERETDEDYRARYAIWDAGLDRNLEFITAGALSVPGVALAQTVEERLLDDDRTLSGAVILYVSDREGRSTEALLSRVRAALPSFRMQGQHIKVYRTVAAGVPLRLLFAIYDGNDPAAVRQDVTESLLLHVNGLEPGAPLRRQAIVDLVASHPGVAASGPPPLELLSPLQDLIPSDPSVTYRTRAELITFA